MNVCAGKSQLSPTLRRLSTRLAALAGVAALAVSAMPTSSAWALAVTEAYIFSDWSAPTNVSSAPFLLNATAGYRLDLNGSGVATSATALSGSTAVQITDRMYYQSHTGTINSGESFSGTMANRVNNEIRRVDDSGLIEEGSTDAALNIDFSTGSTVSLRTSTTNISVPGLVLFEDAGLDPFSLQYCLDGACQMLFNGFNTSTRSTLLANPNRIGTDDYAPGIDQAFWFIFDGPVAGGYFKLGDTSNLGGTRMEVDYVGVTNVPTRRVPEPSTLLLLGSGLVGLPLLRKLRGK
ncbi:MAG: PEP-CTERM sorting domain-containing protein [Nitrospirota bacterium]